MNKEFLIANGEICSCGKSHFFPLKDVVIEKGAINSLVDILKNNGIKKPFILADKNTFKAAGEKVVSALKKSDINFSKFIFDCDVLEPDEKSVGSAIMHFDSDCDAVIGVGSGVINDISKILSNVAGKFYIIVATAPSMDGYASATSSMSQNGLKVSIQSKCADVVLGDIDVLKNAPMNMLTAGLGDMIAKYVSICEWRIAHEIIGEYYCENVAKLVRNALRKCIANAKLLIKRDEEAVKAVFEGLIIGGIAMAYAGVSRPASGVEHYISHIIDMRGLEFKTKVNLHGIQCAVGTIIAIELYEKVKKIKPDMKKALDYVNSFDYKEWSESLKGFLGKGAQSMINNEEKEGKYDKEKHSKRLQIIIKKWDKIISIINEEIPQLEELKKIITLINCPKTLKEAGIDCDLKMTIKATKDIRDKYVLSRLLWDLGVIDEI